MTYKELHKHVSALEPEQRAKLTVCQSKQELIEYAKTLSIPLTSEQADYALRSFECAKTLKPSGKEPITHIDMDGCGTPGWLQCKRCQIGPMVYQEYGLFQCASCGNFASIWGW